MLTTPLPAKRYAEDPFAVTVYATCMSESVGVAAGTFVSDAPEPLNVVATRVPVTVAPDDVVSIFFELLW